MAPKAPKKKDIPPEALMERIEQLTAELKAARKGETEAKPKGKKVVPGKRHYRLLKPHYRDGKYLERGEFITVTDEVKSPNWLEVKEVPKGKNVRHTVLLKPVKKEHVEVFDDEVEELPPDESEELEGTDGGDEDEGGEGRPSDTEP